MPFFEAFFRKLKTDERNFDFQSNDSHKKCMMFSTLKAFSSYFDAWSNDNSFLTLKSSLTLSGRQWIFQRIIHSSFYTGKERFVHRNLMDKVDPRMKIKVEITQLRYQLLTSTLQLKCRYLIANDWRQCRLASTQIDLYYLSNWCSN